MRRRAPRPEAERPRPPWLVSRLLIFARMLRAAVVKAARAFVAPEPFVDFTHAAPRSVHTDAICGMFGIGTPPVPARPIARRNGSLTRLPAVVFAG